MEIAVIAPSKTARSSGDRVNTERKDAESLARLAITGQLTVVRRRCGRQHVHRPGWRQLFTEPATELPLADLVAVVQGHTAQGGVG
jgi:hypothetical protein